MIAKIKDKNLNIYASNILAIKFNGWNTQVIAFDNNKESVILIKYWKPSRNVFEIDIRHDDWIKKDKWEGYDWLINNKKLMKKLTGVFSKKSILVCEIEQAKPLAKEIECSEWFDIKSQEDIDTLLLLTLSFHDAQILEKKQENDYFKIVFNKVWGYKMELRFYDVLDYFLENLYIILDSTIEFIKDENSYTWTVSDGYTFEDNLEHIDWFVKAKKISWKLTID